MFWLLEDQHLELSVRNISEKSPEENKETTNYFAKVKSPGLESLSDFLGLIQNRPPFQATSFIGDLQIWINPLEV